MEVLSQGASSFGAPPKKQVQGVVTASYAAKLALKNLGDINSMFARSRLLTQMDTFIARALST